MRLWLARIFIGLAFSLLLAHNLIQHHHDDDPVAVSAHHDEHDHQDNNTTTLFDNVSLDATFVQKLDFQHPDVSFVMEPLVTVLFSFEQFPVVLDQRHFIPDAESPPIPTDFESFSLRGPPVYS